MRRKHVATLVLGVVATAMATTAANGNAAHAAYVPVPGVITIYNDGTGTYWTSLDPVFWDCRTVFDGPFYAPIAVSVICEVKDPQGIAFACPNMALQVTTSLPVARAGGRATCTTSIDTGVISGINAAHRTGDLGQAFSVTCRAYGGDYPLVPTWTVTCGDPGLPTLD